MIRKENKRSQPSSLFILLQRLNNTITRVLHEYGADILIVLFMLGALVQIEVFRRGLSDEMSIGRLKNTVDIGSTVITTVLSVFGAVAAYRRFLKGRVFSERMNISLTSKPIRKLLRKGNQDRYVILHSVDVLIENVGGSTIWEPQLEILIEDGVTHKPIDGDKETAEIQGRRPMFGLFGVEPGETVAWHSTCRINEDVEVFLVQVEVRTRQSVWHRAMTISNECISSRSE